MQHSRRATAALQALTEADPALAALSLWCRHRDSETVELVATAGPEIKYGPGFDDQPRHIQIGLAGHHILHVALQHSDRMRAMQTRLGEVFEPEIWQIACDAIVNEAILASGHALPRPVLTLQILLGETGAALLAAWDAERLYFKLASGNAGRGDRLKAKAREAGFRPDLDVGDDTEAMGANPDKGDWQGHMARAMAAGRAAGLGLGALGLRLADVPRAIIPWEHHLRRWISRLVLRAPAPAPLNPARRWLAMAGQAQVEQRPLPPWQAQLNVPLPRPNILLAIDASGSIPWQTLGRFMAEAAGLARRLGTSITMVVFDTEIRSHTRLDPAQWRQTLAALSLPEGGGTDFRPVFEMARHNKPTGVIVLTDLDGPFPPCAPRLPVLWACMAVDQPTPPFGRVISLAR